jgi:hypothetical protein
VSTVSVSVMSAAPFLAPNMDESTATEAHILQGLYVPGTHLSLRFA